MLAISNHDEALKNISEMGLEKEILNLGTSTIKEMV